MLPIATPHASVYSGEAAHTKDPKKVAGMFEALFYQMMLSQMREASFGDPLFDSAATRQVQGMLDDEMANQLGQSGDLGIADMMMEMIEKQQTPSGLLK